MAMNLATMMELIPSEELSAIGEELGVDSKNSKITGSFILKSFIRCSLLQRPISLRSIELMCNNTPSLSNLLKVKSSSKGKIDHSSLGKRLNQINPDYFARAYESVVTKADEILPNKKDKNLYRFDSTITTLASRIIKDGMNAGGTGKENQIKLTIGVKGCLPASVRFCEGSSEASEDIALVKAINAAKLEQEDILLFDRGISKNATYQDFQSVE